MAQVIGNQGVPVRKILHVLESPILHGKPRDDQPVHVIWDTHEYSSWEVAPNGNLFIKQYTGQVVRVPDGHADIHVQEVICTIRQDLYFKIWQEIAPAPEPQNGIVLGYADAEYVNTEPDFAIERTQPGHDGYSDDVVTELTDAEVVRPDGLLIDEPEDQRTTIVADLQARNVDLSKYGISAIGALYAVEVLEADLSLDDVPAPYDDVPPPRKNLDWGTLTQPLVTPPDNTFFDGSPETQTETSKES